MYSLASTTWDSEEVTVAHKLLVSGELTMGREVKEFEEQFAKYVGTKYAVMFNSGSSANLAIFAALKYVNNSMISDGDHVIVPAVSWSTTYYPVNQLGFILDFVDIGVKPTTGTVRCRGLLPNPDELITPGMFMRVQLTTAEPEETMLVPERSLGINQSRKYVAVVDEPDKHCTSNIPFDKLSKLFNKQ